MTLKCDRVGCNRNATHKVILEIREEEGGPAAVMMPIVYICESHQDVTLDDVVDGPDGLPWKEIVEHCEEVGMPKPRKEFTNVKIKPLMPVAVTRFNRVLPKAR